MPLPLLCIVHTPLPVLCLVQIVLQPPVSKPGPADVQAPVAVAVSPQLHQALASSPGLASLQAKAQQNPASCVANAAGMAAAAAAAAALSPQCPPSQHPAPRPAGHHSNLPAAVNGTKQVQPGTRQQRPSRPFSVPPPPQVAYMPQVQQPQLLTSQQDPAAAHVQQNHQPLPHTDPVRLPPVACPSDMSDTSESETLVLAFPQRAGESLCDFYTRTGFCKYGMQCCFDHPPQYAVQLSKQQRLPLRPGEPICAFYQQHNACKFGPSCRYHHPVSLS